MNALEPCAARIFSCPRIVGDVSAEAKLAGNSFLQMVTGEGGGSMKDSLDSERPLPKLDPEPNPSEAESERSSSITDEIDDAFAGSAPAIVQDDTSGTKDVVGSPSDHLGTLGASGNSHQPQSDTGTEDLKTPLRQADSMTAIVWRAGANGLVEPEPDWSMPSESTGTGPSTQSGVDKAEPLFAVDACRFSGTNARVTSIRATGAAMVRVEQIGPELQILMSDSLRKAGDKVFQIRLDPVELGRVRITLQMRETGMHVLFTAERQDTLDLLRRSAVDLLQDIERLGFSDLMMSFSDQSENADSGAWAGPERNGELDPVTLGPVFGMVSSRGDDVSGGVDLRV